VLKSLITRAGGALGIPGLYVTYATRSRWTRRLDLDSPAAVRELVGGGEAGLQRRGASASRNASVTAASMARPRMFMCRAPRSSTGARSGS
jgi:hypothetical protein